MIHITQSLLRAATGCTQDAADIYAEHLDAAALAYRISTPERAASWLAQLAHESGALRYVREIASGEAYEGRSDLGNTQPGDGKRYRGRGLIQCTGRWNYAWVRDRLRDQLGASRVPDFEATPEALEQPEWACWSAACWWAHHGCNELADAGDVVGIGRLINRGNAKSTRPANGEDDRLRRLAIAQRAIGAQQIDTSAGSVDQAPSDQHIEPAPLPAGDAPVSDPPPQEPRHMAPIITALLPSLVAAIPKLGALFGSGSEVAQRNVKAAEIAFAVAKDALGAPNEQAVIERVQADPQAAASVRQAVEANWYAITEAGGGGIDGARKADLAQQSGGDIRKSASFWIALLLLPMPYMLVASLIGLIGTATWSDDVRAGLAGSLISAVIGGLVGYYYGQTTTRNRTAKE